MEQGQSAPKQTVAPTTVVVWDWPTRAFHWSLVILIIVAWASFEYSEVIGDNVLKLHRWTGLLILTLLVWRLLWGLFGSSTSRFIQFIPSPANVITYAKSATGNREPKYLGHNPLGSLMILALLGLLIIQATLGLFTVEHNDLTAGPLYRFLSEDGRKVASSWHGFLFENVTLWLIALHIAANIAYGLFRKQPLIRAMITGRKPASDYADANEADVIGNATLRATLLLALSAIIVFGGIWAIGGKFLSMRLW